MSTQFGRPFNPFAARNPVATPGRAIGGPNIWVPQQSITAGAGFSTAVTGSVLYAYSGTIRTMGADRTTLFMWGDAMLRHSAPPASVDVGMFLDYAVAGGTGQYWAYFETLSIPSDTLYTHFPVFGAFNLKSTTNAYTFTPGLHTCGYVVQNNTAGTLEMANNGWTGITTAEIPWKVLA